MTVQVGTSRRHRFALWRGRVMYAVREQGEAWLRLDFMSMSKHDRTRWASAKSMPDLGELVIAWLNGQVQQTPGHCGPPCEETYPLVPALTLINRAGFVTDNSQLADTWNGDDTWVTWVSGFASDEVLASLRGAIKDTPLAMVACRGKSHECKRMRHLLRFCPWRDSVEFWSERCPDVAGDLAASWYVTIEDPEPGRNSLMWGTLAAWAGHPETPIAQDVVDAGEPA